MTDRLANPAERGSLPKELRALGIPGYGRVFFKPYRIIYRIAANQIVVHAIAGLLKLPADYVRDRLEFKQISGGLLVQQPDVFDEFSSDGWTLVAGGEADDATRADLEFAWRAVRAVKSNAILRADDGASVGVGMGQVNRVDSCRLAVSRAGDRAAGSVAASDAFFPFADGLQILLDAQVRAVVQPGGSIRDADVIEAAQAAGVTMYFTAERHFYH